MYGQHMFPDSESEIGRKFKCESEGNWNYMSKTTCWCTGDIFSPIVKVKESESKNNESEIEIIKQPVGGRATPFPQK